jgi:hypothetical protein
MHFGRWNNCNKGRTRHRWENLKIFVKNTRCQSADQIQTAPVNTATTIRVTWQRILMTSWATISSRSLLHGYVIKIKNGCEEENVISFTKYTWFEWFSKSIPTVSLNGINRLVFIVRNVFCLRGELKFYIYDLYKCPPNKIISSKKSVKQPLVRKITKLFIKPVFLNRRAAARYRALASIIPGREWPEETTICYKISLVQLITNLIVILYLSTCHTVYISVLILFMIMP